MDRKLRRKLQRSFEKRCGSFGLPADTPPDITRAFLEQLLECPDCRAAVLEACNGDDRKTVDIDEVIRGLTLSRDH